MGNGADVDGARPAMLSAIFKSSYPGVLIVYGADGRYWDIGGKGLAEIGLTPQMLEGKTLSEAFDPATAAELEPHYQRALAGEDVLFEVTYEGELFTVRLAPIVADDGQIIAAAGGSAHDITGERALMRELMVEKERFRAAFADSPIGMAMRSLQGQWMLVNRSLAHLLGYEPSDLQGHYFDEFTHPDDQPAEHELVQQLRDGTINGYVMEKRYLHRLGHVIWARLSVTAIHDTEGNQLFHLGQMQDITETRELLDALQRSNEDLAQYAYLASHDLQAPLRTISGFAYQLRQSLDPAQLDERQQQMLAFIDEGVTKMQVIIRDVLSYNRLAPGERPVESAKVCAVVSEITDLLSADIEATRAEVSCSDGKSVFMEAHQLRRVLQHLIQNGIDHRHPDRPPRIVVTVERTGPTHVRVSVSDNGLGIPPQRRDAVFGIFRQLNPAAGGTGIGLATVRRIVELHGGSIGIEGNDPVGTTIHLTLPAPALVDERRGGD